MSTSSRPTRRPRRPVTQWDRPSQVILESVLLLVMLVAIVLTVLQVATIFGDREVAVPVEVTEQALEAAPGASLVTTQGLVTLTDASSVQLLTATAPMVLGAAVLIGAAYCLYRVARSLRAGTPFHRANARRLITAALIVLFGGFIAGLADVFSTMSLAMDAQELLGDESSVVASGTLPLTPIGIGLLLLALAEFFRRGTELSDDVEGLV